MPGPEYRIKEEYGERDTEHSMPTIRFEGISPKERMRALEGLADYFQADRFSIASSTLGMVDLYASYTLFPSSERCKLRERIEKNGFVFLFTYAAVIKEVGQGVIRNDNQETKHEDIHSDVVRSLDQLLENISKQYQRTFDGAKIKEINYTSNNYTVVVTPGKVEYLGGSPFQLNLQLSFLPRKHKKVSNFYFTTNPNTSSASSSNPTTGTCIPKLSNTCG